MTIETWSPDTNPTNTADNLIQSLDKTQLTQYLSQIISLSPDDILAFVKKITPEDIQIIKPWMKLNKEQWLLMVDAESDEALTQLIYFFTALESCHALLEAGNDASVIGLNKVLKSRGYKLPKDCLLWIKSNSQNKFLPNGSIF